MHRAAQPLVKAGEFAEDFGQRAIEQEVDGKLFDVACLDKAFDGGERRPAHVAAHDREQVIVGQLVDSRERLGEDFAVRAVRAEDKVLGGQVVGHAHGCRLLADGEMGRPLMLVLDALVDALLFDAVEHGLKLANVDHVTIDAHEVVASVLGCLLLGIRDIGVDGDFGGHQAG